MATREVKTTKDYKKFKTLVGNRHINEGRIGHLVSLMREHGNRTDVMPVIVNQDGYIIDGQHRLEALKRLGWHVGYVVQDGNIETVRVINQGGRNWGWRDIATSYADLGSEDYRTFLWFIDEYGLPFTATLMLISETTGGEKGVLRRRYLRGDLKTISRVEATLLGNQMVEILDIAGEGKNSEFYKALVKIIKSPLYDHSRMLRKLNQLSHTLNMRDIASNYMRSLEDIYNQGYADENKVRLF